MSARVVEAIKSDPHWRVLIRPGTHAGPRIQTLAECWAIVERNRVRLRGWDYPAVSTEANERENGDSYVASWCDWQGFREYWRFYQSTQFIHLLSVIETTRPSYRAQFEEQARSHMLHYGDDALGSVQGYVGFVDLLFTVTQVFEFAVRLSLREVYEGELVIEIGLNNVQDFILGNADPMRGWHQMHFCRLESIKCPAITTNTVDLIGGHPQMALDVAKWFYERFDWHDPSEEVLRSDQARLLSGFKT